MNDESDKLFHFPCEFSIKVTGLAQDNFETLVTDIVHRHCKDLAEQVVKTRTSSGGKYLAVTVTFTACSRAQLDDLYTELSHHERVLMVL